MVLSEFGLASPADKTDVVSGRSELAPGKKRVVQAIALGTDADSAVYAIVYFGKDIEAIIAAKSMTAGKLSFDVLDYKPIGNAMLNQGEELKVEIYGASADNILFGIQYVEVQ